MSSSGNFQSISTLSNEDQVLFAKFAYGPAVTPPHSLVHEAFENQVDTYPSAIAAKHAGNTITYAELDLAANRLANYLIESGLTPQQRVCLVMQRSIHMIVGILAVLKSGCQYVPLDGGVVSNEALQHTLSDTGASFILVLPKFEDRVKVYATQGAHIVCLGTNQEEFSPSSRPPVRVAASHGAYAIYTSGEHIKSRSVAQT